MKRIKYLVGIFHLAIIAVFFLSLNGCGYKKEPYYLKPAPKGDKDVEFIIKEPKKQMTEEQK